MRRPRKIPRQLLTLTASGDYAQLIECKIIAVDTEKRPLGGTGDKKIKLAAKMFLLSAILFVVLSHRLSRSGELHVKAMFSPPSWVAAYMPTLPDYLGVSRIIQESPGYGTNLPVFRTGGQTSRTKLTLGLLRYFGIFCLL